VRNSFLLIFRNCDFSWYAIVRAGIWLISKTLDVLKYTADNTSQFCSSGDISSENIIGKENIFIGYCGLEMSAEKYLDLRFWAKSRRNTVWCTIVVPSPQDVPSRSSQDLITSIPLSNCARRSPEFAYDRILLIVLLHSTILCSQHKHLCSEYVSKITLHESCLYGSWSARRWHPGGMA
jgi:hypothetical protein